MTRAVVFLLSLATAALLLAGCEQTYRVVRTLEDAADARIGVMTGTVGEAIAQTRFPRAQHQNFQDVMDAVAALSAGKLDAVITSHPTALQVAKKNPALQVLPDPLRVDDTSVAVRKGERALLAQIDQALGEMKQDGTLAATNRRWFRPGLAPYEEIDIPVPTTGVRLRIGVTATREPMNFVDANGRVTGHEADIARLLGVKLQRPIEFHDMPFMALLSALESGKIDAIITGMTSTPERRQRVDFSVSYFQTPTVLLVRKSAGTSSPQAAMTPSTKLQRGADLEGKRIAVLQGSAHETYATKTYPTARVLQFQTMADVVLAVKTGKADAGLNDALPLAEILKDDPALAALGEDLFSFPVGVAFNKNQPALRAQFNQFLADLRRDGSYDALRTRWLAGHTPQREAARRVDAPNGVLTIGTAVGGAPFVLMQDNQLTGFDIELAERFAASQGKKAQFLNMEFGGLIAAVASGKVDFVIASIFVTEERKKQVDFGDPYFEMGTRAFALASNIASDAAHGAATGNTAPPPGRAERLVASFRSNLIEENRYLLILDGLRTTVVISIFATLFGTLLGALVCFMRMSPRAVLHGPASAYIAVLRGTPVLVLLMLLFYVVFGSVNVSPVLVAVLAFGMNFGAYAAEIFRAGIRSIDPGQTEAGIAMGFGRIRTFAHIVLPQALHRILPVYKGEFLSLVKMTSIVGYIAVQDLTKASDIIRSRTFDAFFPLLMVAVLYFVISWLLMQVLQYLERQTDPKQRRKRGVSP